MLIVPLLLAAGVGLAWWGLAPRIDLQASRAEQAEQQRDEALHLIELQAGVLAEQQRQIGAVTDIERHDAPLSISLPGRMAARTKPRISWLPAGLAIGAAISESRPQRLRAT